MKPLLLFVALPIFVFTSLISFFIKAKDTIHYEETPTVFNNRYVSDLYNYEIQYPDTWTLREYDWYLNHPGEGESFIRTIELTKKVEDPGSGPIPEIIIGTGQVYSTSGALCANEYCLYDLGIVEINSMLRSNDFVGLERLNEANPEKSYVLYRFRIPIKEVIVLGYPLDITAQYVEEEDREEIFKILNTINIAKD